MSRSRWAAALAPSRRGAAAPCLRNAAAGGALLGGLLLAGACAPRVALVLPGPVPPRACPDAAEVTRSVFLVGSAGGLRLPDHPEAELPVDPVLRNLREEVLERAGALGVSRVAVIYLGDNVKPAGLAPVGGAGRSRGERVLRQQITAAGPARAIFVAGDRDWSLDRGRGSERVRAQHGFLALQGERVAMKPAGGCPGPERIDFGPRLRLLFLDPIALERALHPRRDDSNACTPAGAGAALLALSRELDDLGGRHAVLALHSAPVAARLAMGDGAGRPEAPAGPRTWAAISRALRPREPLLVAGGHPHNLQLHRDAVGAHYLVSGGGSASRPAAVAAARSALYAEAAPGYARLDVHADGALSLTLTTVRDETRERALRHCLAPGPPA